MPPDSTIHLSTAIPIHQSLPPIGERVLVWAVDGFADGRWTIASRHSRWIESGTGHIIHPSHWMPLPSQP